MIKKILEKYAIVDVLNGRIISQRIKGEDFDKLEKELEEYMLAFRWNKAFSDKLKELWTDKHREYLWNLDKVEFLYPEKPISKSEWDKTNVLFTNLESLKKSRKKWFNRKKKDDNFIDKWFKNNARNTKKK